MLLETQGVICEAGIHDHRALFEAKLYRSIHVKIFIFFFFFKYHQIRYRGMDVDY